MSKDKELYVTKRGDGRYNVLRPDAARPSAVEQTQREAIDRAKKMEPDAAVHIQECAVIHQGPTNFDMNSFENLFAPLRGRPSRQIPLWSLVAGRHAIKQDRDATHPGRRDSPNCFAQAAEFAALYNFRDRLTRHRLDERLPSELAAGGGAVDGGEDAGVEGEVGLHRAPGVAKSAEWSSASRLRPARATFGSRRRVSIALGAGTFARASVAVTQSRSASAAWPMAASRVSPMAVQPSRSGNTIPKAPASPSIKAGLARVEQRVGTGGRGRNAMTLTLADATKVLVASRTSGETREAR